MSGRGAMQVTNPAYSSGTRLYNRALCDSHRNPLNRFARDFQESLPKYREQIAQYASDRGIEGFYSLIGHGSKNQVGNVEQATIDMEELTNDLNRRHGRKKWAVVYGGDPYDEEKPDVAALAKIIYDQGGHVVAVQCCEYAPYMVNDDGTLQTQDTPGKDGKVNKSNYPFLDAAIVYSTEMKKDGAIMFGGCHHGNVHDLVGTTRYLFHLLGHSDVDDRQLLKGSICCGGGPVSIQEYQEFFKMGYPCYYLPVEARYRVIDPDLEWGNSVFNKYGIVHQWVYDVGLREKEWVVLDKFPKCEWASEVRSIQSPADNHEMMTWKMPFPAANDNRIVVDPTHVQREVELAFTIKQVYSVSEQENTIGVHFEFTAQVEVTPEDKQRRKKSKYRTSFRGHGEEESTFEGFREESVVDTDTFIPPVIEFSNAVSLAVDGEDGWHLKSSDWIELVQNDPVVNPPKAFRRISVDIKGVFLTAMSLESFPFDTQLFNITVRGGDIETERFAPLMHPPAVMLPTAAVSAPSWKALVYEHDTSGNLKYDLWCGMRFGETGSDRTTGMSCRTATCTFALSRRPDSVMFNIGLPVTILTMSMGLIYTIPITEDAIKDERLNIFFIVFLSFIALKIVVMEMLPYLSFIEWYIMWAIVFVGAVAASNAVMLLKVEEEKLREADRMSMWASLGAWVLLHIGVFLQWRKIRQRRQDFLIDNALAVEDEEKIREELDVLKSKADKKRQKQKPAPRYSNRYSKNPMRPAARALSKKE